MRMSRSAAYAVNALAHLAAAGGRVPSHEAAAACGIPERFALKVLRRLVCARLVRSQKGPHGGVRLARPLSSVTLLEVVEVIDGPLEGCGPLPGTADPAFDLRVEAACLRAAGAMRRELAGVSLADLVGAR
jgi:Rrf2 family protein